MEPLRQTVRLPKSSTIFRILAHLDWLYYTCVCVNNTPLKIPWKLLNNSLMSKKNPCDKVPLEKVHKRWWFKKSVCKIIQCTFKEPKKKMITEPVNFLKFFWTFEYINKWWFNVHSKSKKKKITETVNFLKFFRTFEYINDDGRKIEIKYNLFEKIL